MSYVDRQIHYIQVNSYTFAFFLHTATVFPLINIFGAPHALLLPFIAVSTEFTHVFPDAIGSTAVLYLHAIDFCN